MNMKNHTVSLFIYQKLSQNTETVRGKTKEKQSKFKYVA